MSKKTTTPEPDIPSSLDTQESILPRLFSWYNSEKTKADAKQYLLNRAKKFLPEKNFNKLENYPESDIISTYGWLSRLSERGINLKIETEERLDEYILTLSDKSVKKKEIKIESKPAKEEKPDNSEEKLNEILGEVEGAIDDFIKHGKDFDLYALLKINSIPKKHEFLLEKFLCGKKSYMELVIDVEDADPDFAEGHSNLTLSKKKRFIKFIENLLEQEKKHFHEKSANRKPRKKKQKPPVKQAEKVQYKLEDSELNFKSIHPTEIIGATQVWVLNTKYNIMSVYRTERMDGFSIKGTTIQNFDESISESKRIKNPEEFIKAILDAGKVTLRTLLTDIKTKSSIPTGRINSDCLIIRAIK